MACAELVLPGDFDHSHHGGSGLGSGCAHTVSLYRQELEEVQEVEGGRAGRSAGAMPWGSWLEVLQGRKAHRQECLCHLDGCQAFVVGGALLPGRRQECLC